jgi:hypothetical protein
MDSDSKSEKDLLKPLSTSPQSKVHTVDSLHGVSELKAICPFLTKKALLDLLKEWEGDLGLAKSDAIRIASLYFKKRSFRSPSVASCSRTLADEENYITKIDLDDPIFAFDSHLEDSDYDDYVLHREQVLGSRSEGSMPTISRKKRHQKKEKKNGSDSDFVTSDSFSTSDWSGSFIASASDDSDPSSTSSPSESNSGTESESVEDDENDLTIDMKKPF